MDIEEIEALWSVDSKIDMLDIATDSSQTYELHSKYYKILNRAKYTIAKLNGERSKLSLVLADHYLGNLDKDTMKQYGLQPFGRTVLKSDVPNWVASNNLMVEINLSIAQTQAIIDFLDSIIRAIHNKGFVVRNIIEQRKFENGGH